MSYGDGVTIASQIVVDGSATKLEVLFGATATGRPISELNGPRGTEDGAGLLI